MATLFKGEKLIGRSNYIEWLNAAVLYLEINGYMAYIDGTEREPDIKLYFKTNITSEGNVDLEAYSPELAVKYSEKLSEFERANKKALEAIKSIISLENTERFKDKKTARDLWSAITTTYGSTG